MIFLNLSHVNRFLIICWIFVDSSRQYEQFIKEEVDLDQDGMVSKKEIIHKMEKMFSHQRQSEVDQLINKYDIGR